MKRYTFPYYVSFGKNDHVDCSIICNLSEEDAKRLIQSAKEGGRVRLIEDCEIQRISALTNQRDCLKKEVRYNERVLLTEWFKWFAI